MISSMVPAAAAAEPTCTEAMSTSSSLRPTRGRPSFYRCDCSCLCACVSFSSSPRRQQHSSNSSLFLLLFLGSFGFLLSAALLRIETVCVFAICCLSCSSCSCTASTPATFQATASSTAQTTAIRIAPAPACAFDSCTLGTVALSTVPLLKLLIVPPRFERNLFGLVRSPTGLHASLCHSTLHVRRSSACAQSTSERAVHD